MVLTATKKTENAELSERAVGRRKTSSARVRLTKGKGAIIINDKKVEEYFPLEYWQKKIQAPLEAVSAVNVYDISAKVVGGGVHSQVEAVRHGIARALLKWDAEFRKTLKASGFLTRDARAKERKKPGRKRARRGHQWRKR